MTAFTIDDAPYAGDYGGGRQIAVILYEGSMTAYPGSSMWAHAGESKNDFAKFAAPVAKGDLVKLVRFASNKFETCMGKFAVEKADADGDLAIGRVIMDPVYYGNTIPTSNVTINDSATFATAIGNGYFNYTTIELFTAGPIYPVQCGVAGSGNIVAGDSVVFDVSDATWAYGDDGDVADNGVWDDSGADTGSNSAIAGFMALNSADTDDEYILVTPMFAPVRLVA